MNLEASGMTAPEGMNPALGGLGGEISMRVS